MIARPSFAGQCGFAALAHEGVEPEHSQVWVGKGGQAEERQQSADAWDEAADEGRHCLLLRGIFPNTGMGH